jgi:hypothetical protein
MIESKATPPINTKKKFSWEVKANKLLKISLLINREQIKPRFFFLSNFYSSFEVPNFQCSNNSLFNKIFASSIKRNTVTRNIIF